MKKNKEVEQEAISFNMYIVWKDHKCTKTLIALLEDAIQQGRDEMRQATESLGKIDIDNLNLKRGALVEIKKLREVIEDKDSLNDFINKQEEEDEEK